MQKQQFGIMDQGYFVPKSQILSWINSLLQINITKIQALGSGSIYCQLFDVIHSGKINLAKVNWKAKNDTQFLANFRLLQTAFQKSGIKRHIQVQKLVKAKYQDNLQFIQWFKRYFDTNCGNRGQGYDAVQKRNKIVPDFGFCQKTVVPKVYNATGQVAAKDKVATNTKKQQVPPRLKSPRTIKTPVVSNRVKTPLPQKKQQQKKQQVKKEQPKKKPAVQPPQRKSQTQLAQKHPITSNNVKKTGTSAQTPDNKIKELTEKLQMIKQIVKSQDGSDMKVDLIKQLLGISKPVQVKKTQPTSVTQLNTISEKQQELQQVTVNQNATSNNDDLLTHEQEPQSEQLGEVAATQQVTETHEQPQSQTNQGQLQEKPDFSQVAQSEHDDDII